jgi:carbon-monoxide dehydrogenase iron sulfur subunit
VAHSRSKDLIKAFKEEIPRPISRIKVHRVKPTSFGLQCRFCEEPLCVAACLTGAMHLDEDGLCEHDVEKCGGCGTCILLCPFGAIQSDEKNGYVVARCDMCVKESEPYCVSHCPNRALVIEEFDDEEAGEGPTNEQEGEA